MLWAPEQRLPRLAGPRAAGEGHRPAGRRRQRRERRRARRGPPRGAVPEHGAGHGRHRHRRRPRDGRADLPRPHRARRRARPHHPQPGRPALRLRQPRLLRGLRLGHRAHPDGPRRRRRRPGRADRPARRGGRRGHRAHGRQGRGAGRRDREGRCSPGSVAGSASASRRWPTSSRWTPWSSAAGWSRPASCCWRPARATAREYAYAPTARGIAPIVPATFGGDAGKIGAALLALEHAATGHQSLSRVGPCPSYSGRSCATSARRPRRSGCRPTARPPSRCSAARRARSRWPATTTRSCRSPGWSRTAACPTRCELDGERVWPPEPSLVPAERHPHARAGAADTQQRIIFGSCRYPKVADPKLSAQLGHRRARRVRGADGPAPARRVAGRAAAARRPGLRRRADTPQNRRRIAGRRDRHPDWPDDEIVGFEEYVGLYRDSWTDPEIRWLMSTVPTAMIFDDHDVRDDWNTSAAWRARCGRRRGGGSGSAPGSRRTGSTSTSATSPPDELAADPDYRKIVEHDGDVWPLLVELADRADAETDGEKGVRFSFRWDLGRSRLADDRLAERPASSRTASTSCSATPEFAWIEEQVAAPGSVDHLVIGTSVPWLLPHAIGDLRDRQRDRRGPARLARAARRGHPAGRRPGALGGVPRVVRPAHRA